MLISNKKLLQEIFRYKCNKSFSSEMLFFTGIEIENEDQFSDKAYILQYISHVEYESNKKKRYVIWRGIHKEDIHMTLFLITI